jgi:TPR repeat protein
VAKDQAEAVKWYRKAAEQNFAAAQYNLAVCYDRGDGVAEDHVEAVKWYRKAAEQNFAEAQYNLGICYERGDGVAEDWVEAKSGCCWQRGKAFRLLRST